MLDVRYILAHSRNELGRLMPTRQKIMREWFALLNDRLHSDEHRQKSANAFFCSMIIFAVAFAYYVLSVKA